MNVSEKELIRKNLRKHPQRILKAKRVSVDYLAGNNIRVSNYIKIIDKEYVIFILQEDYKSP